MFTDKYHFKAKANQQNPVGVSQKISEQDHLITVSNQSFTNRQIGFLRIAARVTVSLKISLEDFESLVPLSLQFYVLERTDQKTTTPEFSFFLSSFSIFFFKGQLISSVLTVEYLYVNHLQIVLVLKKKKESH